MGAGSVGLSMLTRSAQAADVSANARLNLQDSAASDRVLVVVQLAGGNDGLNTIVPYGDGNYYGNRPTLGIQPGDLLTINNQLGFHPALSKLKAIYDAGEMAIIQAVGYPQPNRSHFRSMDIWHSAHPESVVNTGWLGRFLDIALAGEKNPLIALSLTDTLPLSLRADTSVPSVSRLENYQILTDSKYPQDRSFKLNTFTKIYTQKQAEEKYFRDFAQQSGLDAYISSEELKNGIANYSSTVQYPNSAFSRSLQSIAKVMSGNFGTRIYYTSIGGFDTHANQIGNTVTTGTHAGLWTTICDGIEAFYADLQQLGKADNTIILFWSEFGRRVRENASRGTDHGAAAPMFVVGKAVKGGIYGDHPSLAPSALQDGDVKFSIDFRSVYATILDKWFASDANEILDGNFERIQFL